jgi:hypothetical protein
MARLVATILTVIVLPGIALAADDDYLHQFFVPWTGGGTVKLSLDGSPWQVNCHLNPSGGSNSVTLTGNCRLKFIFFLSNDIEAKLRHDPASASYSGTYVVDGGPPAMLSGRRTGETLTLKVRWPTPVNGHPEAVIVIMNDNKRFTLTTIDTIGLNGKPVVTSDLAFNAPAPQR